MSKVRAKPDGSWPWMSLSNLDRLSGSMTFGDNFLENKSDSPHRHSVSIINTHFIQCKPDGMQIMINLCYNFQHLLSLNDYNSSNAKSLGNI